MKTTRAEYFCGGVVVGAIIGIAVTNLGWTLPTAVEHGGILVLAAILQVVVAAIFIGMAIFLLHATDVDGND